MRGSDTRILTTHVGSLSRNSELTAQLIQQDHDRTIDEARLASAVETGIADVVAMQLDTGIDIGNDGEQPRIGYATYPTQRMTGFGGESARQDTTDLSKFPLYAKRFRAAYRTGSDESSRIFNAPQAIAQIRYDTSLHGVRAECDMFESVLKLQERNFTETFMTAISPGSIVTTMHNAFYASDRDYIYALAAQMKLEYDYIVSRGHVLQIDAPDLAMERQLYFQNETDTAFLERVELHIEALNMALVDIPRERVRMHVCWGTWDGPHIDDTPLAPLLPRLYEAQVGALSLPFSNPRHQHEYKTLRACPLPDSMFLIPGVIDNTTNYLEHPEVVANRILQAVDVIGDRERVVAGADCGFSVFADYELVTKDICQAKFLALRDGASIASAQLWGKPQ